MTRGMTANTPRRIAPLDPSKSNIHNAPKLKGIIFDVDGTLCLPQNYMFQQMRDALGIRKPTDILEHINSLSGDEQHEAKEKIKSIEREAMSSQQPQPGLVEMVEHFTTQRPEVRLALCTRNFELPVRHLLDKFLATEQRSRFWPIVTRETEGVAPKPSAEGIWACVHAWNGRDRHHEDDHVVPPKPHEAHNVRLDTAPLQSMSEEEKTRMCEGVIMVGDSVDDMEAGCRAGAATVLLVNQDNRHLLEDTSWPRKVDLGIQRLDELIGILEGHFEGR